jgi:hypothetical protein
MEFLYPVALGVRDVPNSRRSTRGDFVKKQLSSTKAAAQTKRRQAKQNKQNAKNKKAAAMANAKASARKAE